MSSQVLERLNFDEVVNGSRHCDRIKELLEEVVFNDQSNCFGTALDVFGLSEEAKQYYDEIKYSDWFRTNSRYGDHVLSNTQGNPFYIGPLPFELFLSNRFLEKRKTRDSLVVFTSLPVPLEPREVEHAGVYLGQINGEDVVFHQPGTGEGVRFRVEKLSDVARGYRATMSFHLPRGK